MALKSRESGNPTNLNGILKELSIKRIERKLTFEVFLSLDYYNEEEYFSDRERLSLCCVLWSRMPFFFFFLIFQSDCSLEWKPNLSVIVTEPLPNVSAMATSLTYLCCLKGFLRKMPNIFTNILFNIEFKILSNAKKNPETTEHF